MILGNFHDPTGPSFPVIVCVTMVTRRQFSQAIAGMLAASRAGYAQTAAPDPWAGATIVDCHHHLRPSPEANIAHLDGAAISNAVANAIGVRVPTLPLTPEKVLAALAKGGVA